MKSKQLLVIMQALSQCSVEIQSKEFDTIAALAGALAKSECVKPRVMLHHCVYDETPLKMRLAFQSPQLSAVQIAKVWLVQHRWANLLEEIVDTGDGLAEAQAGSDDTSRFLLLCGDMHPPQHPSAILPTPNSYISPNNKKKPLVAGMLGPRQPTEMRPAKGILPPHLSMRSTALRAGATGSALTTLGILQKTWEPDKDLARLFTWPLRLTETDEAPSNLKTERLMRQESLWTPWHSVCAAHKAHNAAQRVWALCASEMKAMSRTLLCFRTPKFLQAFQNRMRVVVARKASFQLYAPTLSEDAKQFRNLIYRFCTSSLSHRGRRVLEVLGQVLLNGDWRQRTVVSHHCPGPQCCRDRTHFIEKLLAYLDLVFKTLRARVLNRANWLHWPASLDFLAWWLALHNLLGDTILEVCNNMSDPEELLYEEVEEGDQNAMWRVEAAENLQICRAWLQSERPLDDVLHIRLSLFPEIDLITKLVSHSDPSSLERKQLQDGDAFHFPARHLVDGSTLDHFFAQTASFLRPEGLEVWRCTSPTEAGATKILQLASRAAATVFINIVLVWSRWPLRALRLLQPD